LLAEEITEPGLSPWSLLTTNLPLEKQSWIFLWKALSNSTPEDPSPSGKMGRRIPARGILAGLGGRWELSYSAL